MIRKEKTLILELKLLKETYSEMISQRDSGKMDLMFRLAEIKKNIPRDQKDKYIKSMFPQNVDKDTKIKESNHEEDKMIDSNDIVKASEKIKGDLWTKKLYKKIALKTHPDKLCMYPEEDRGRLICIYKDASSDYESGNFSYLFIHATDANIKIDSLSEKQKACVRERIAYLKSAIKDLGGNHYWIWSNLTDEDKKIFLKNHLSQLGYTVCENEIDEALRKKPERKTGTRPVSMLKNRM